MPSVVARSKRHTSDSRLPRVADPGELDSLLRLHSEVGRPLAVDFRSMVKWPAYPERATHLIHPYPAKLLAHIPFFFLANDELSKFGDVVFDPFCGSGTVLLESILAGRNAIGCDANPLARLIASVKTNRYDVRALREEFNALVSAIPRSASGSAPDVVNLQHWFYPHVIRQLTRIAEAIAALPDGPIRAFFQVCFSGVVRKVSLADPRLSVPVRLRQEQYPRTHWLHAKTGERLRQLKHVNAVDYFQQVVLRNITRVEAFARATEYCGRAQVLCSDARDLIAQTDGFVPLDSRLRDGSVRLAITSPPYAGAQKYIRASSLSLGWLGLCASTELREYEDRIIGREHFAKHLYRNRVITGIPDADRLLGTIRRENPLRAHIAAMYLIEMREVLAETARVLMPGGHLVLVAGNNRVCGRRFLTAQFLKSIVESLGFQTILELVDDITSRGLMTKRNRTAGVISQEWVFVFQKPL